MTTALLPLQIIDDLVQDLQTSNVWMECLALLGCLLLAWSLSYFIAEWRYKHLRGQATSQSRDSVWFGRKTLDGLLFPLLSLVLVYLALRLMPLFTAKVVVLRLVMSVLLALAVIRLVARVLMVAFPKSAMAKATERGLSWIAFFVVALWLLGLLQPLMEELESITLPFGKTRLSLRTVFDGLVSALFVMVLALWLSNVIEKRVVHHTVQDLSMRKAASNVIRSCLLLLGLLLALSAAGVDLTTLSVLGGALGVGLGLGLQKLAANYVSGFVILLERSLRIGDNVKIDEFEGKITDIKTRYTLIRANNGRESIVPNEHLITQRIENFSLADPKISLLTSVTVGNDSDPVLVQKILCDAALTCQRVLHEPEPSAMLTKLGADGLEFTLAIWIMDPENGQLNVRSEVNIAVLQGLRKAKIDIPYPQRVLHMTPNRADLQLLSSLGQEKGQLGL